MLVTEIVGRKSNGPKNFIVTDVAMTEIIRPALYSAYHHITALEEPLNKHSHKVGQKKYVFRN